MIKYKYNPNPVKLYPTSQIRLFRFFYEPKLVHRNGTTGPITLVHLGQEIGTN